MAVVDAIQCYDVSFELYVVHIMYLYASMALCLCVQPCVYACVLICVIWRFRIYQPYLRSEKKALRLRYGVYSVHTL